MDKQLIGAFEEIYVTLAEKKSGILDLQFPANCDSKDIVRAAEKDASVKHGGNHDTVVDPETGEVITQIPRHSHLVPNTCRAIIKALKQKILKKKQDD